MMRNYVKFKDILDSQSKAEQNNVAKKPIVSYCGSGVTACLTMLAMVNWY